MKLFYVLLIVCFSVAANFAVADENLLENPGFEESVPVGENPSGWWSWNSDCSGTTSEVSKTGEQAVSFSKPPEGTPQAQGMVFTLKDVKPQKEYVFSAYVLNSKEDPMKGKAYGQLSIEWRRGGEEISRSWGTSWGTDLSSENWGMVSMTAEAPEGTDECFFVINFFTEGGSGTFYADDVAAVEK